jgi:hypothetical protein
LSLAIGSIIIHVPSGLGDCFASWTTANSLPSQFQAGIFAAHAVAAAVVAALSKNADVPTIFTRTRNVLKIMHDANPSWGPLFVAHPGDTARHPLYIPQT